MAGFHGGGFAGAEPLLTQAEASERHQLAVDEWVWESPATIDAVMALIEFAGVVAADKLVGEALRESGPVSDEKDVLHQTIALSAAARWINDISPCTSGWIGAAPPTDRAACHETETPHERPDAALP